MPLIFQVVTVTSRTTESRNNFKSQAKLVANLISSVKRTYYKDLILQTSKQPKKLWSTLQSLLSLKTPTILPISISASCLAKSFLDFFKDKIARLSSSLTPNPTSSPHLPPSSSPPSFNTFSPTSHEEVQRAILMSSNSTSSLDTIHPFLLKSCLDSLLTPISNIINF